MLRILAMTLVCFAGISVSSGAVFAQGVLMSDEDHMLPRMHQRHHRPNRPVFNYRIKALEISSSIKNQIAQTQVSQTFVNMGQSQIEAAFVFPLPYEGAIDSMTFLVDGKEYPAKLLPNQKARKIYEGYVLRNQDPALLEWVGQGMFKTSVFPIPPGAERTVQLTYTQLIRQDAGTNDYLVPLTTAKYSTLPIESFSLRCVIQSNQKLNSIYSPTHSDLEVDRTSPNIAVIQLKRKQFRPLKDIRILYNESNRSLSANLMTYWPSDARHGYFTLLVTPEIERRESEKPKPKTVLFVLDRSGSMSGKKIEQAREAAKFILNNLRDGDRFNIVTYASDVKTFRPELQTFDSQNRQAALGFVESIFSGGGTNIDSALKTSFKMLQKDTGPQYVLFLTDGLPTQGETNEMKIASHAEIQNTTNARLINFGVGYDVNSRLLDRLARDNQGQSQYVRPDENLEEHVSRLYSKISAPVLTNASIQVSFGDAAANSQLNRYYPADHFDLFAGEQLVLVGRYQDSGRAQLSITGNVGEQAKSFDYDVDFRPQSEDSSFDFCAKLWATRRIGEIIDLIDLQGKNSELVAELVRLSTQHGIVTPYTSYLADDLAHPGDLSRLDLSIEQTESSLEMLEEESGASGFALRGFKSQLKNADSAALAQESQQNFGRIAQGHPLQNTPTTANPSNRSYNAGGLVPHRASPAGGAAPQPPKSSQPASVRGTGKYTAYLKGKTLIASNATDIDPIADSGKLTVLIRFSNEYFELLQKTTTDENQLLALQEAGEEMIVRLQGKAYHIK